MFCTGGHTLQILKAHEDNFGKYSCIAANEAGEAEHHYNLKVYSTLTKKPTTKYQQHFSIHKPK